MVLIKNMFLFAAVVVAGCSSSVDGTVQDVERFDGLREEQSAGVVGDPVTVNVMTFNVFRGGEQITTFNKTVEAVLAAGADVVAVQDAFGNSQRLATSLGWGYVSSPDSNSGGWVGHYDIVSRYPIVEYEGYVMVHVDLDHEFVIANAKLNARPYGPDFTTILPVQDIVAMEMTSRFPEIDQTIDSLSRFDVPTVITGDYNSPSHLD